MTLRLRYSVRSHVGMVREGNEDSAYAGSRLALVADGMGGHAAGEVASSAVVAALAQLDEDEVGLDLLEVLASAVQTANDRLRAMVDANSALDGMGTTLTVMLSSGTRLGLAHVGDSRAYLLRDGEFSQITHDQTLVQRMVDEGRITPEQAETHPQRSLLTQALDGRAGVEPDLSVREARRDDRYLLCSDGLSGFVSPEAIAETLAEPDADQAAERLIELALAAGAPDNVTVVIADVVDDSAGLPVIPVVGGAAAESDAVPSATAALVLAGGASLTPDERLARRETSRRSRAPGHPPAEPGNPVTAGAFRRSRTLDQTPPTGMLPVTDDPVVRRRRSRWYRRPVAGALAGIVVVVGAGVLITWAVVANSWYVARSGDHVALFHGLQTKPLGISLSAAQETGIPIAKLVPVDRERVRTGIVADSHADGVCILARLQSNSQQAIYAAAASAAAAKSQVTATPKASATPKARAKVTRPPRATPTPKVTVTPKVTPTPTPTPTPSLPPTPAPLPRSCTT